MTVRCAPPLSFISCFVFSYMRCKTHQLVRHITSIVLWNSGTGHPASKGNISNSICSIQRKWKDKIFSFLPLLFFSFFFLFLKINWIYLCSRNVWNDECTRAIYFHLHPVDDVSAFLWRLGRLLTWLNDNRIRTRFDCWHEKLARIHPSCF